LSPYFRGTATNFWALEQGLPECVGATVHLATASVDAGPILRQFRPPLEPGDDLHDAGCKVVIAAAAGLPDTVAAYADHRLRPTPQHPGGLLFRSADFDEAALARTHRRLANGLIQSYLADKAERDAAYPIVE
jgi:methionyl-tRNA formyltransferase